MLTLEFHLRLQAFRARTDQHEDFAQAVEKLAGKYRDCQEQFCRLAESGEKHTQASSQIQSVFTMLHKTTANISPRAFYRSLESFKSDIADLFAPPLESCQIAKDLTKRLETFADLYDAYLATPTAMTAAPLILEANTLHRLLQSDFAALDLLDDLSSTDSDAYGGELELSIALYQPTTYTDLIDKLRALLSIYDEFCHLLAVSQVDFPLRIGRVESGSLWIKVFGETKVLQLITSIIEATIGYLHRKFTDEGRIAAVPRKVESLDAVIQMTQKLRSLGLDTNEVDANLKKSAVAISHSLAVLLEGQPRVALNEHILSVGGRLEPLLLAQRASSLLLGDGRDRIDPSLGESGPNESAV